MSLRACVLLFLLLAPAFNLLTVVAAPTAVNYFVLRRIVEQGLRSAAEPDARSEVQRRKNEIIARGGINVALPAPRADAQARTVVRPSPDLLYTACVFDLSRGAIRITAPVQNSYVSVSGFDAGSSNFFAINDREVPLAADGSRKLDLVLSRSRPAVLPTGARLVLPPGDHGLILFRSLITDEEALPRLRSEFQARQRCDPL